MSVYRHKQPIWNWSSVVLLSTLLLSPMAATTLLHALSQVFPHASLNAVASAASSNKAIPAAPAVAETPRRTEDEDEALRRMAARSGQLRAVRLDDNPHGSLPAHALLVALIAPARVDALVLDTALAPHLPAGSRRHADLLPPRRNAGRATPPRAPPAA